MPASRYGVKCSDKVTIFKVLEKYVLENDAYPTTSQIDEKIAELIFGLSAPFVSAYWKIAGSSEKNDTPEEPQQVNFHLFYQN